MNRSDVLFWWNARNGPLPRIGGDPVFERQGVAYERSSDLKLRAYVRNVIRPGYALVNGVYVPVLPLERANSNKLTFSNDFTAGASWIVGGTVTITAGQASPQPALGATKLSSPSPSNYIQKSFTTVGDGTKAVSIWLRKGTSSETGISLYDTSFGHRRLVVVTWAADGSPIVTGAGGAGLIFPAERYIDGWWRIAFLADSVVAANPNTIVIYPSYSVTGDVHVFGAQVEDIDDVTSYVHTNGSVTSRTLELFYWTSPPSVQAMLVYVRWIKTRNDNSNTVADVVYRLGNDGSGAGGSYIQMYCASQYFATQHHNGTLGDITSAQPLATAYGDVVEGISILNANGTTRTIAAVNEVAPLDSGNGATPMAYVDWLVRKLSINGAHLNNNGAAKYQAMKIVKLSSLTNPVATAPAAAIMREVRELELSSQGDVV